MIDVRSATKFDAPAIAAISSELGYPTSPEQVTRRSHAIAERLQDHGVFVSTSETKVVGWVHVYGVHLLESDGYAEIGGLVVLREFRRLGAGRALMSASEVWAKAHGFTNLRLRSGMHRVDEAHLFYQSLGYVPTRQSMMFRKNF